MNAALVILPPDLIRGKDLAFFSKIPIGAGRSFAPLRMAAYTLVCEGRGWRQ